MKGKPNILLPALLSVKPRRTDLPGQSHLVSREWHFLMKRFGLLFPQQLCSFTARQGQRIDGGRPSGSPIFLYHQKHKERAKRSILHGLCCTVVCGGNVCKSLSILLCKILISFTAFGLLFIYLLIYAISGIGSPD